MEIALTKDLPPAQTVFESKIDTILKYHSKEIEELEHKVYGNGKDGIITEISNVKAEVSNIRTEVGKMNDLFKDQMEFQRKVFIYVLVAALAGGSVTGGSLGLAFKHLGLGSNSVQTTSHVSHNK